jgi:N-acetylglucosamine-6-phosphate deacetylase
MTIICFKRGAVFRGGPLVIQDLWIANGKVIPPVETPDIVLDMQDKILSPGFIDLQLNGGFGIDLTLEPEKLTSLAEKLPSFGVTSFLAAIISSDRSAYARILSTLRQTSNHYLGAHFLGIHLEGPFLHPSFSGAHPSSCLQALLNMSSIEEFYGPLDKVKIVTLAPELPLAYEAISMLSSKGIVVSAGHSAASIEQVCEAKRAGLSMVTHLYNAMIPFSHRAPGLIGAVLSGVIPWYSMICDGVHVHPAAVKMAWRANKEGFVLVSDAMSALGLSSGQYTLGKNSVEVSEAGAILSGTNKLAGSLVGLDAAVRNLIMMTGCSIPEALAAATIKPAKILGIEKTKGSLEIGADADLVVLNAELGVEAVYISGNKATRPSLS